MLSNWKLTGEMAICRMAQEKVASDVMYCGSASMDSLDQETPDF